MTMAAQGDMRAIQEFWHRRGLDEAIVRHDGRPGPRDFREHPVWLAVIPLLLAGAKRKIRRVADMGSGTGIVAELLARLGYDVIAIEFAESRAAIAHQRLRAYPGAEIRVGDAMDPPLAAGEADAIVSRNLIWMLPQPAAALQRWQALVAPGGRIAAIDATRRLERSWPDVVRARFGLQRQKSRQPVSAANPTPLANPPDEAEAMRFWSGAGLENVMPINLAWVGAVRLHQAPVLQRALLRSRFYAVTGDSPAA